MFDAIDGHEGDVAALTAAEQDQVVDECYQCKLCYLKCPYVPPHEWAIDFPKLMLRAAAVRRGATAPGRERLRRQAADQALGHTDLTGRLGSALAPVANRALIPGSLPRRVMARTLGIAAERVLPPYARERFTTWFRRRPRPAPPARPGQGEVAVFPTCVIEYQRPAIGRDLVKVYEHNGVGCSLVEGARCCGAPWLHAGDHTRFEAQARANLGPLRAAVAAGRDIVVAQPTCGYVLKHDYPEHLRDAAADEVAARTFDATEYLWRLHKSETGELVTVFPGHVPESIAYHAPCHLQAQRIGLRSRDLLRLTGAKVTAITKCSGIDGTWGYRAEHYEEARQVARPLAGAVTGSGAEVVAGDCALANGAIEEETGRVPRHPLEVLARAYGLPEED
jgi:Fe-S oxidoreductase